MVKFIGNPIWSRRQNGHVKDELTRISTFTFSVVVYKSSNRTFFSFTKFKF